MREKQAEPNTSEARANQGTENQGYVRSQSDHYLSSTKVEEDNRSIDQIKRLLRANSAAASTFPIIDEIPTDVKHASPSKSPLVGSSTSPSPVPAPGHPEHPAPASTVVDVCERQSSLLDPMSDRVSTILVWQNITVSALSDKKNPLVRCFKSSEPSESKKKCLLHGVTGAITGGLWAVIGNSLPFSALSCPVCLSLSLSVRSLRLWQIHLTQHLGLSSRREHSGRRRDASQRCCLWQCRAEAHRWIRDARWSAEWILDCGRDADVHGGVTFTACVHSQATTGTRGRRDERPRSSPRPKCRHWYANKTRYLRQWAKATVCRNAVVESSTTVVPWWTHYWSGFGNSSRSIAHFIWTGTWPITREGRDGCLLDTSASSEDIQSVWFGYSTENGTHCVSGTEMSSHGKNVLYHLYKCCRFLRI